MTPGKKFKQDEKHYYYKNKLKINKFSKNFMYYIGYDD